MGHQRLGRLPRSKAWRQVIALIAAGADLSAIASSTSIAAEASMIDAASDAGVRESFWLLTQIPLAAREADFTKALKRLGAIVPADPTVTDVVAGIVDGIDRLLGGHARRSDYGELATLAVAESLYSMATREPDLLGDHRTPEAFRKLGSPNGFAALSREFFTRLTRRHFAYYLSRELTTHVGPGHRFASLRDIAEFEEALDVHCREASRIIKEFSAGWYSKQNFEGGIDRAKAGRFVHAAAKKVRDELRARRLDA